MFLYDEVEQENSGYCCSKAQNCEKIKLSSACKEKVCMHCKLELIICVFPLITKLFYVIMFRVVNQGPRV